MSAAYWTPAELALLRRHYPELGITATVALLPGRSPAAVREQAHRQGLTAPRGGRRVLSAAQLEEMAALRRRNWSCQRIAEHFTAAGTPISAGAIGWQCLRVGADAPARFRRTARRRSAPIVRAGAVVRPFSPREDREILRLEGAGLTAAAIARQLGRKPNSVIGRQLTLARHQARAEATS